MGDFGSTTDLPVLLHKSCIVQLINLVEVGDWQYCLSRYCKCCFFILVPFSLRLQKLQPNSHIYTLQCPADQLSRGWRSAILLDQVDVANAVFFLLVPFPCIYKNYNQTAIYTRYSVHLIKLAKYILPNWLPKYKTAVRK